MKQFETFGEYMFDLLFAPLKKGRKTVNQLRIFFKVMGREFDDLKAAIFRVRSEANVASCSEVMLPVHGQDRDMPRLEGEDAEAYHLILYGSPSGESGGWFPGADVPFIGVDGFCSPIGAGWESVVTSEFGYRSDPFTGETRGHTGIDLAVPTGTPIRAALPGTVTVSQYNSSYGYYVIIDHGNGLSTLYGHNSRLLAQVGQTVEAGDIISLSGSTGRSTGPHLHFEVRVNGERTNPRYYLPKTGG